MLVIYALQTCCDHLLEHFHDSCAANMLWSFARTFLWFMCCEHAMIICLNLFMIYVLQTCRDHSVFIHSCDLCAATMPWLFVWMIYRFDAMFIPVIYVLRTCRDYLFEYFICFHTLSCDLCAANMPWSFTRTFYDLCAANMLWSFHTHSFLWFMCYEHAVIICLNVLPFWCHVHSSNLCAANMPWLLVWIFYSLSYTFL
jgi:hypothetical protein